MSKERAVILAVSLSILASVEVPVSERRSECVAVEFYFSHQRNGNYTKIQLAGRTNSWNWANHMRIHTQRCEAQIAARLPGWLRCHVCVFILLEMFVDTLLSQNIHKLTKQTKTKQKKNKTILTVWTSVCTVHSHLCNENYNQEGLWSFEQKHIMWERRANWSHVSSSGLRNVLWTAESIKVNNTLVSVCPLVMHNCQSRSRAFTDS